MRKSAKQPAKTPIGFRGVSPDMVGTDCRGRLSHRHGRHGDLGDFRSKIVQRE
jgi:hypothetical protein